MPGSSSAQGLAVAEEKMRRAGISDAARAAFRHMYGQLVDGGGAELSGDELEPVHDVRRLDDLPREASDELLNRTAIVKLAGGLGTSMGLSSPKALVEVKPGHSFLDVIVAQVLGLRGRHEARLPLVLMTSFSTQNATLEALERYDELAVEDLCLDFLQSREPKLRAADLHPIHWPADPLLEWCPPGHGDLYAALIGSGMLDALLERDYRYAFVSNADNLGATLDPRILEMMAREQLPFVMEVVQGTEADRKGGHIARRDGRLVLRETAQVPRGDDSFTDIGRWRYFNTNSLWLDLPTLADRGAPALPLIVNHKNVDPADASTPEVLQLEAAMGAALGSIEGAEVVCVPRTRFVPVKTTNDLLVVRSDAYHLTPEARFEPASPQVGIPLPVVDLDPRFYKHLGDFEARFPAGPPSLVGAESLVVRGNVTFGAGTIVTGAADVRA